MRKGLLRIAGALLACALLFSTLSLSALADGEGTDAAPHFTDVSADAYYADAVAWAVACGVTTGVTDTAFQPSAPCTRAQAVTFLWRAAGSPVAKGGGTFADVGGDAYYADAVAWAVENGVTVGVTDTLFQPDAPCTRGQIVTFLWRAAGSPVAEGGGTFADVSGDAYYADAVAWAVENGVTAGVTDTAFQPSAVCTRGQIVTFLCRAAELDPDAYEVAAYTEKGDYTQPGSFRNAAVRCGDVLLQNKVFYGDVVIEAGAESGPITLENVVIRGTLKVLEAGGPVKLENCRIHAMTLSWKDVEVCAAGRTDVDSVLIQRDASLQESDLDRQNSGFENLVVSGTGNPLYLTIADVSAENLEIRTSTWVSMDSGSQVQRIAAGAPAYVRGSGMVEELTASSFYVYYENRPGKLSRTGNYPLPQAYNAGDNYWNHTSSSDGDDYDPPDVSIGAIGDHTLLEGQTAQISVLTDAQTLTAVSNRPDVASVSVDGTALTLRAQAAGTAAITVTGRRSGYDAASQTFTVTVEPRDSAPVISSIAGIPTQWQNTPATITFQVVDAEGDLASVTVNGTALSAGAGGWSFQAEKNGTYQIAAADRNGNTAQETVTVSYIDTEKPVIGALQVSDPETTQPEKTVTFTVDDEGGSGLKEVTFNGESAHVGADGSYTVTVSGDGIYEILAKDQAGNEAQAQGTVSNIVPICTWPSPDTMAWGPEPSVFFELSDAYTFNSSEVKDPLGENVNLSEFSPGSKIYSFKAVLNGDYTLTVFDSQDKEWTSVCPVNRVLPSLYWISANETTGLISVGVIENLSYATTTFFFSDVSGAPTSQIRFQYSLSCADLSVDALPALTQGNATSANYISLQEAVESGKVTQAELNGVPGWKFTVRPGHDYTLRLRPVDRETGEPFPISGIPGEYVERDNTLKISN